MEEREGTEVAVDFSGREESDLIPTEEENLYDYFTLQPFLVTRANETCMDGIPSYLLPTVSSTLPPYQHGEIERIRNSYRTGSCCTIKKLPNALQSGAIQSLRKKQIVENLILAHEQPFKPSSRLKDHVFTPHSHITMNYDKTSYINKHVVEEEKVRTDSYSRKPFVVSSRIRFKFEDIFDNPNFVYPNMGPGVHTETMTRSESMPTEETKFSPEVTKLTHKRKLMIEEWSKIIFRQLEKDWKEYSFRIRFLKSQELVIQFRKPDKGKENENSTSPTVPFPPPNNALLRYMQHLATHGVANDWQLQKRGDRWHVWEGDNQSHVSPSEAGDTWESLPSSASASSAPSPKDAVNQNPPQQMEGSVSSGDYEWFVPPSAEDSNYDGNNSKDNTNLTLSNSRQTINTIQQSLSKSARSSLFPPIRVPSNLEPMAEETSQGSLQDSPGKGGKAELMEHNGTDEKVVYLTFSFYAPWVKSGQQEVNKKRKEEERHLAQRYAEKRAWLYNPDLARKIYGDKRNRHVNDKNVVVMSGGLLEGKGKAPSLVPPLTRMSSMDETQQSGRMNAHKAALAIATNVVGGNIRGSPHLLKSLSSKSGDSNLKYTSNNPALMPGGSSNNSVGNASSAENRMRHISQVFSHIDLDRREFES
eukprot:gene7112-7864_t